MHTQIQHDYIEDTLTQIFSTKFWKTFLFKVPLSVEISSRERIEVC